MGIVYYVLSFRPFKMGSWVNFVNTPIIPVFLLNTSLSLYIYFCVSLPTDCGLHSVICFGKCHVNSRDRMPALWLLILSGSIKRHCELLAQNLDFQAHKRTAEQSPTYLKPLTEQQLTHLTSNSFSFLFFLTWVQITLQQPTGYCFILSRSNHYFFCLAEEKRTRLRDWEKVTPMWVC